MITPWALHAAIVCLLSGVLGAWVGSRGPPIEGSIEMWGLAFTITAAAMFEYQLVMFD